jgi:hypothetical protein
MCEGNYCVLKRRWHARRVRIPIPPVATKTSEPIGSLLVAIALGDWCVDHDFRTSPAHSSRDPVSHCNFDAECERASDASADSSRGSPFTASGGLGSGPDSRRDIAFGAYVSTRTRAKASHVGPLAGGSRASGGSHYPLGR